MLRDTVRMVLELTRIKNFMKLGFAEALTNANDVRLGASVGAPSLLLEPFVFKDRFLRYFILHVMKKAGRVELGVELV